MIRTIRFCTASFLLGIAASASAVTAAPTEVANDADALFGAPFQPLTVTAAASSYSFGSVPVGSASAAAAISFTVNSGTTVGSIQVLTGGVAGLDFAAVAGGTCVAGSYSSTTNCTVNVTLTPKWPGLRAGAVVLADASGNALATVPVYGTGTGPELGYMGVNEKIVTNFTQVTDLALDGAGNMYIVDQGTANVYKIAPGSLTTRPTIGSGWVAPVAVAVDGAGNVYVSDNSQKAVYKVTPAGVQTTVVSGLAGPDGVAVDGAGNLYVADRVGSTVYKITPSGTKTTFGSGFAQPNFLAVDAAQNLYVTDLSANTVYKVTPSGTSSVVTNLIASPIGVAVDAAGDVYVATGLGSGTSNGLPAQSVFEIVPGGSPVTLLNQTTNNPYPTGLALDSSGNLYIANSNQAKALLSAQIMELVHSVPPTVYFNNTTPEGTADSSEDPQLVTVQNIGTAVLDITAVSFPADFPQDSSGSATDCNASTALQSSATCTLSVDFKPVTVVAAGSQSNLTEYASLTSNTLNVSGTLQNTTITGTESGPVTQTTPTITWAAPAAITYGTALSASQLNATASVAGTFAYSPASGTVLTAGTQTLKATFTPTNTTSYTTASATVALTVNKAIPTITWATPASITPGTALSATQLNATASVAGTFVYTPASGTVESTAGSYTLSVTFTPTDTTDYNSATKTVTLTVAATTLTTPTITWTAPAAITYGTALSATQLNATASVAGTFAYSPASGTVLTAGTQTLKATFTPTNTTSYTTASATVALTVNKAIPTITWATPASITPGTALSATQLNATASVAGTFVYTPASGTVESTAGSYTLSVTFTPTDTTDYNSATKTVTLTVAATTLTTPTITWATPAAITYGTALSSTQLNAKSSVAGTFAYTPASGTVLTAGVQTLKVVFTPTNTASYATATQSVTITVNQATPTITWSTPAAVAVGTALSSTQLNATASKPGTFVYSPAAGTVESAAGSITLTTTFTPTDAVDYKTATKSVTLKVENVVATPAFSLAAGTYTGAQKVTITCATSGATIYYTTNGSTPTTRSTKYSAAITVSASETVKALAIVSGDINSTVASAAYTIK